MNETLKAIRMRKNYLLKHNNVETHEKINTSRIFRLQFSHFSLHQHPFSVDSTRFKVCTLFSVFFVFISHSSVCSVLTKIQHSSMEANERGKTGMSGRINLIISKDIAEGIHDFTAPAASPRPKLSQNKRKEMWSEKSVPRICEKNTMMLNDGCEIFREGFHAFAICSKDFNLYKQPAQ